MVHKRKRRDDQAPVDLVANVAVVLNGRMRDILDRNNLEPEDLVALTIEAAAMAGVPLAGTDWIPGRTRF
jgi:hypothetical protein